MYPDSLVWVFFVIAYTNVANEARRTRLEVDEGEAGGMGVLTQELARTADEPPREERQRG